MKNTNIDKKYQISFKQKIAEQLGSIESENIALLITNEYEGFSRNGGIGTYYTSLSQKLDQAGWCVILILCQSEDFYGGKSDIPALDFVFSTGEAEELLNLNIEQQYILQESKNDFYFKYQSIGSWLFTQAIANTLKDKKIYVEFPDVNGFGYDTIQAKKSNLLGENCLVSVTIHGCFEWVFEANDSINKDDWFNQSCYREQTTFENVDLAFFPSYFLKNKIETYGWQTSHAHNRPYFVLIQPVSTFNKIDEDLLKLPLLGMTSNQERSYVKYYTENEYTGQGEIVDLGSWLGSFTLPLILGLKKNKHYDQLRDKKIHAYERFIWKSSWMEKEVIGTKLEGKYKDDDNFLDGFLEQIYPHQDMVNINQGDLMTMSWNKEKSIEFLLVDAMKNWDLANHITQQFFPALIPNVSLIQHQDFCHYNCSWIHLIMYKLRDYFEPILYVPNGSVIFLNIKPIPEEYSQKTYSFADFSPSEINQAFAYSSSIVPHEGKANIQASKIMLYIHLGELKTAKKELDIIEDKQLYSFDSDLSIVKNILYSSFNN
ncbi:hypothetical protein [Geminocystis herdmanii]|uniref:hypothetical protein n=1 Tax=Geminocystis herdmanii TaxID=669359 RepID=UPI00034B4117|nr:hypothetical protein [Geminocystis herdmanii]